MHDSRGAKLQVGDRVFIEAAVIRIASGGDENNCCVSVEVVTPDQPEKKDIMPAPYLPSLSARMMTKIGTAVAALLLLVTPASAQESIADRLSRLEANLKPVVVKVECGCCSGGRCTCGPTCECVCTTIKAPAKAAVADLNAAVYFQASGLALVHQEPLIVFVGVKGRVIKGATCCQLTTFEGDATPRIIVAVFDNGGLTRYAIAPETWHLPATATDAEIERQAFPRTAMAAPIQFQQARQTASC